ncbi:hypothetical protein AGMMS49992_25530 [Clostridia bacterium]|nr:hypothetical protein AGMMS49992_25530 [Clostridia bacterium]
MRKIVNKLLPRIKANLIIQHNEDDGLLRQLVSSAIDYAERFQHLPRSYYNTNTMPESTMQAIVMLTSHWFESRDGSTGGFFGDSVQAAQRVDNTVNDLLRLGREWEI